MSNKTFSYFFAFSLGAAAGSVVAWRILKDKYERIAQEEIDSVKETFYNRLKEVEKNKEASTEIAPNETQDEVEDSNKYESAVRDYNTVSTTLIREKKEDKKVNGPYVISPDEYGEDEEYECESLTYYADGVLTDEVDEIIENVDDIVGEESLNHFGDNDGDEDSVFVKNDRLKCYYEILRDTREYKDIYSG